jgi:cell division protein FtsN
MARRRSKASRKRGASQARRGSGSSALAWFLTGLLLGLGLSALAIFNGLLPRQSDSSRVQANAPAPASDPALITSEQENGNGERSSRFDFFTVLPEMEVVVPEQELVTEAGTSAASEADDRSGNYILQAGSFRNPADADQLKAQLALLGAQSRIQAVTVNDVTWHRVRIGPIQGARRVDELRRMLLENDIETLVLKDNS